jgi:hypothetical protein
VIAALEDCYARFWTTVFGAIPRERLGDALGALELLADAVDEAAAACCGSAGERNARTKDEVQT